MMSEWNVKPPGVASVSNVKSEVTSSECGDKRGGEGEDGLEGGGGGESEGVARSNGKETRIARNLPKYA